MRQLSFFILQFVLAISALAQEKPKDSITLNSKHAVQILQKCFYDTTLETHPNKLHAWKHENIWNSYNTCEVLIDYSQITGFNSYLNVIKSFVENKFAFNDAKYAGYDDAQWAGITLIKAYSLFGDKKYLSLSIELWNYIIENSWDSDFCNGGLWWNIERTYKNAITNELFIVFSTMLYFETNEAKYKDWALKTWKWFEYIGMLSFTTNNNSIKYLVNDGINEHCKNNNRDIWTYNQGVLIGGLVNLWKIFKDQKLLETAIYIANSSIDNLTEKGILVERPNNRKILKYLNTDQQQFKGIFVRHLSALIMILPDSDSNKTKFINLIKNNYRKVCQLYPNNRIGKLWNEKSEVNDFNAITQTSGLDLFNARLKIAYWLAND